MSADRFRRALSLMNLSENERTWYPNWVQGYAGFHSMREIWEHGVGELRLDQESVIAYLRSLRDSGVAAWRRHQAARALEVYQGSVLRNSVVDFRPIREKLQEIARREKGTGAAVTSAEAALVDGEGNAGMIDPGEPEVIQRMRARMRVLHHPISTEQAYVGWVARFIRHLDDERFD